MTINIHVQVFIWSYVFNFLGYVTISESGIAGCNGNFVFNFLWSFQTTFRSSCIILLSQQQWEFQFLHIFIKTCYCPSFFSITILNGILLWFWLVFPLGLIMVNIFSQWPFVYLPWRNVLSHQLLLKNIWLSFIVCVLFFFFHLFLLVGG